MTQVKVTPCGGDADAGYGTVKIDGRFVYPICTCDGVDVDAVVDRVLDMHAEHVEGQL